MKNISKSERHRLIIEIVSTIEVSNQAALAGELLKRGHRVTQTTVSRDLSELNMMKTNKGYVYPNNGRGIVFSQPAVDLLKQLALSVDSAGNMVVVKTLVGSASQIAIVVDTGIFGQVVGTVAGADTVVLVTQSVDEAVAMKNELARLLDQPIR